MNLLMEFFYKSYFLILLSTDILSVFACLKSLMLRSLLLLVISLDVFEFILLILKLIIDQKFEYLRLNFKVVMIFF